MIDTHNTSDTYDSPWKDVLEHAFPEFMAFYFPAAHARIDWARGHEFKNTELRQVVRDVELGKRFADALVQITLKDGEQRWIYIHIEVQAKASAITTSPSACLPTTTGSSTATPVPSPASPCWPMSKAWRPDSYGFEVLGCRHPLEFPVVKLIDYADRAKSLEANPNPFALVTAAHLRTRQTKSDPQARYRAKLDLVRSLYRQGWDWQRILDLFAVLDWMMRLPEALEQQLWQAIETIEGETEMPLLKGWPFGGACNKVWNKAGWKADSKARPKRPQ